MSRRHPAPTVETRGEAYETLALRGYSSGLRDALALGETDTPEVRRLVASRWAPILVNPSLDTVPEPFDRASLASDVRAAFAGAWIKEAAA